MVNKAIDKINNEMVKKVNNSYVQYIGEYMVDYVIDHPEYAEAVMEEGKSIDGSLAHMNKVAEKKKIGNMAMLTPDEGFAAVLDYFGIKEKPVLKVVEAKKTLDISLDDLL